MPTTSKLVHQVYFDNGVDVVPVTPTDELPVTGDWLTDAELRASPVKTRGESEYLFSEYQASLADGAEIVTSVLDMETVDKWQGEAGASVTGMTVVLETSSDAAFSEFAVSTTNTTTNLFELINLTSRQRYLRVRFQNNTGSPVASCYLAIKASYGSSDKLSVLPLSVPPENFSQAALVASVSKGQDPLGAYTNARTDGSLASTTTPLGAAASVTLGPFSTVGWKSIELYVATDQVSATSGVVIEYTQNPSDPSPTYYPGPKFDYTAVEVTTGFMTKRFAPALGGFRLTYTNGGTPQGANLIALGLKTDATEPQSVSIENQINSSFSSLLERAVITAKNDIGTYGNILRGPLGGLRASIYEHESETPIKPLNNLSGNATTVGSAAPGTQIASAPPAGTKTIEIQADPANTKVVYLGFASGVTSGNAPIALNSGDARVFEVEGTPQFWAISASGSQTVRWTYIAEV